MVRFSLPMAVFAWLEDDLAFGASGNLPGARAALLTMSPPTSIAAEPQRWQFQQQFCISSSCEG